MRLKNGPICIEMYIITLGRFIMKNITKETYYTLGILQRYYHISSQRNNLKRMRLTVEFMIFSLV